MTARRMRSRGKAARLMAKAGHPGGRRLAEIAVRKIARRGTRVDVLQCRHRAPVTEEQNPAREFRICPPCSSVLARVKAEREGKKGGSP